MKKVVGPVGIVAILPHETRLRPRYPHPRFGWVTRATGRGKVTFALFLSLTALFFSGPSGAIDVPIASCTASGGACTSTPPNPVYEGPGPANWEDAIQLGCRRFAAAHRVGANCACGGTVCSTVTSCSVISIVGAFVGAQSAPGTGDVEAVDSFSGNFADFGERSLVGCTCPPGAGFKLDGSCQCNGGLIWNGTSCVSSCTNPNYLNTCPTTPVIPDKNSGSCGPGNPCNPGAGIKIQRETVFADRILGLELVYNSRRVGAASVLKPAPFAAGWSHSFGRQLITTIGGGQIGALRPDGRVLQYLPPPSGNTYLADADIADRLDVVKDAGGTITGWTYYDAASDATEQYDAPGKLLELRQRNGQVLTFTYSTPSTPPTTARKPDLLIEATDQFGRKLQFFYDMVHRVVRMLDVGGQTYLFGYDEATAVVNTVDVTGNNLTTITFPDLSTRRYHYNEPANTSGASLLTSLTGITDENGVRFATYKYDTQGRPISTEHAGGAELTTFAYNGDGSAVVTDPLGVARTYGYSAIHGVAKNTGITGPVCPECGPASQTFDANGNVSSRTDWNGNRTNYVYDLTRNLETSRTEGLTSAGAVTPATRTIETQWHATLRLPTQITEKDAGGATLRTTSFTHDANGNVLTRTVTAGSNSRTWTYTYNANGSVLTMNGPRTDVSDVTTYTYYDNAATCPGAAPLGCRGQVETVTNAAGHVTQITEYNAHGQPLTIVDPNNLTTTLAYDSRQRLTSRNVGGEITSYEYDGVGQLTKVTLPDSSFLSYTYDAAHRLKEIGDNLGNRILYTLDAMGNRTLEEVRDPANALAQTRSRVYSSLNRLAQEIGAAGQMTAYAYDNQGNVTAIDGPLAGTVDVTANLYDALNRLTRVTDPNSGQVNYGYNPLDQLTSVTDPRTLVTSYGYDGLNNLNQQVSPDTGTTNNTYDAAGNLLTQTDAKGQVTTYTYDALNRITSIAYQGGATHGYQYDQGINGLGRLTQITEPNSITQYVYNQKGRLTSETRTLNAIAYVTGYSYDAAGRMTSITYPSGRQITYTLDSLGRIQQIDTTQGGTPQTVVSNVAYRPFGPVAAFTFGNGQTYTRGFDQDGRIASYTLATQATAVCYDAASRIIGLSANCTPPYALSFGYDSLDRLTQAILPASNFGYGYDAVGNRTSRTAGANTDSYAYPGTSNRLSSITPASGPLRSYLHDANGSVTADGLNTYAYDTRGRLTQAVSVIGASTYQVNSLGQRIRKTNTQGDTVYHYDAQGRLIAESSPAGAVQREYLYLGDIPVAVIQ